MEAKRKPCIAPQTVGSFLTVHTEFRGCHPPRLCFSFVVVSSQNYYIKKNTVCWTTSKMTDTNVWITSWKTLSPIWQLSEKAIVSAFPCKVFVIGFFDRNVVFNRSIFVSCWHLNTERKSLPFCEFRDDKIWKSALAWKLSINPCWKYHLLVNVFQFWRLMPHFCWSFASTNWCTFLSEVFSSTCPASPICWDACWKAWTNSLWEFCACQQPFLSFSVQKLTFRKFLNHKIASLLKESDPCANGVPQPHSSEVKQFDFACSIKVERSAPVWEEGAGSGWVLVQTNGHWYFCHAVQQSAGRVNCLNWRRALC